jgi:prepilin-type N-terminal cleavage/methylation domain-containing protein
MRRRGFTLLEALISIGILAGLFTAIYGVQAGAVRSVRYARDLQRAALLARDKVLEVEWKLKKDGFSVADMTMEGDFDDADAPEFRWRAEVHRVRPEAFEGLANMGGGVADDSNPLAAAFAPAFGLIGQQLADQVREVRLWVMWKDGTYEESFDVVTHIVKLAPATAMTMGSPAPGSANSVVPPAGGVKP